MLPSRYRRPTIDLFNDFMDIFDISVSTSGVKTPVYDVIENEKEYVIEMLLAGVPKENINIDIDKDVLTIKAERKEVKDVKYNRKETYFGKYERSFVLPENADKEKIEASLVDGILKVIVPKQEEEVKNDKIKIEIK